MEIRFPRPPSANLAERGLRYKLFYLATAFLTAQSLFIVFCSGPAVDPLRQEAPETQIDRTAAIAGIAIQELAGWT
jgi:hypothetical protein